MSSSTRTGRGSASAWTLGIAGIILFVTATGSALQAGRLVGETYDLIAGYASFARARYVGDICNGEHAAAFCDDAAALDPARLPDCRVPDMPPECAALYTLALGSLANAERPAMRPLPLGIWEMASAAGGKLLGPFSPRAVDLAKGATLSLVPLLLCAMSGLVLVFVAIGLGSEGVWAGAVISPQYRVSLSLIQVVAWTIVLVAAYSVVASFNVGLMAEASLRVDALSRPGSYFPTMPGWSWGVLGITVASPFAASLIKSHKPAPDAPAAKAVELLPKRMNVVLAPLERRDSAAQASVADLFFGEDQHDRHRLDLTRVQNVLFTIMLLLTYVGYLVAMVGDLSPSSLLRLFPQAEVLFGSLPDPGPTFVALLGVTHATYLAGKLQSARAVDPTQGANGAGTDTGQ